jgi:uncharacterized membrane protein YbhN (UPF0104 family)
MIQLLAAMGGMIAWAVQFTIIYGVTSLVCARGYRDTWWLEIVPLTIVVTTLVALAATAAVLVRALEARRLMDERANSTDRFLIDTTLVVSGLSIVIIAWHGLPALIVPVCA